MTQPKFAPIPIEDEVRPVAKLAPPRPWSTHRPGDFAALSAKPRGLLGVAGPDQGYVLSLTKAFAKRLVLCDGEDERNVVAGIVGVALRRASAFGRAPVALDLEVAFLLFGYLGEAPDDLVAWRRPRFRGVAHDYEKARNLVDAVHSDALFLRPDEIAASLGDWRSRLGA